jgi:hypothetical protein
MSLLEERLAHPVGTAVTAQPAPVPAASRWCWSIPEAVAVATAGFALPGMALLLVGRFAMPLVLSLGLAGAVVAVWALGPERGAGRSPRSGWTLAALALAAAAFLVNARFASQDLYAVRDPGTYLLTGQWLAHHDGLPIDTQPEVFGSAPDAGPTRGTSAGFGVEQDRPGFVYAQGNHLLPVFLAVAGRLGGEAVLLKANALLGALALLAMFGLVRRFAGEPFGLLATAALAVSLPMVGFSRDAYTEPLALLLLFGGLSVLWRAVESGRPVEFALAGLTTGAVAMDRVDGYAALLAVLLVGVGYAGRAVVSQHGIGQHGVGQRRAALGRVGLLLGGLALPGLFGFWDVAWLSDGYYRNSRPQIIPLLAGTAVLLVLGAVAVVAAWRSARLRRLFGVRAREWWARAAAVGVLGFFAVLASRPWWQVGYEAQPDPSACNPFIPQVQAAIGLPVEPCRSYDELTVHWLAWYLGWPALVLGVVGLALLVRHTIRRLDLRLLGMVGMTLSLSLLYLTKSNITPDQIWAMRRYLPVVLPGLLGAAGYVAARVWSLPRWWARPVGGGLGALLVGVPAAVTHPMELVRQYVPQLAQVRTVCQQAGRDGAVLVVGKEMADAYGQTVRGFCHVPVQAMDDTGQADLAAVRTAVLSHDRRLYVITQDRGAVPWTASSGVPAPLYNVHEQRWPTRLVDVPQHPESAEIHLWMGLVLPDGSVRPLPPPT